MVESEPMTYSSQSGQGAISNILAVAGFIILIAIIVWGAYHFLEIASSGLASLFGRNSDAITVTLSDDSVTSGETIDLSWKYTTEGAGVYTVLYQCQEGLQIRSVTTAGVVTAIPCGAAFPLGNEATKSARLIPSITGTKSFTSTLTVIFNPAINTTSTSTATAPRPQGSAKLAIAPTTGTQTTTTTTDTTKKPETTGTGTGTKTTTKPSTTGTGTVAGTPDLQVSIIAVGVIDAYTGAFVARTPVSPEEIVAVKFDVANRGSAATGSWYFNVELPTEPASPFASAQQNSLAPGAHIENTLRFNQVPVGGGRFSVSVDSSNSVKELSESNNTTAIWVTGPSTSYYYPYAY